MIKQKDITAINVDDYIREQKKSGKKFIIWDKKKVLIFRKFARATFHDPLFNWRMPHSFPDKALFMGIKHFCKK